jgi:putative membrane protein
MQTPQARSPKRLFGLAALGLGGVALIGLVTWFGALKIGREVLAALWVVPITLGLHMVQLQLSAVAWRVAVGKPPRAAAPGIGAYILLRWVREAVNSMLPVAQMGGNFVGIRLLAQRGVPAVQGGAGTTIDITIEAVTQFLFTLAGVAALAAISPDRSWAPWVQGLLVVMALAVAAMVLVQRAGAMRLVEALADRLARVIPAMPKGALRGLHAELVRLQRDRGGMAQAGAMHLAAWLLGAVETWLVLAAMGQHCSLAAALVIDSLGMAARSAGFVVPGALGVQEAGLILAAGLVGVPAEAAIALSMLKRVRELAVGASGLLAWQWIEGRRFLRG